MRHLISAVVVLCALATAQAAQAAARHGTRLLGDPAVERHVDTMRAGRARAFRISRARAGTVTAVRVYVDRRSRARTLTVGLYADRKGRPGRRLAQASHRKPRHRAWTTLRVHSVKVASGRRYWIALLGRGGKLAFRDRRSGSCVSVRSAHGGLRGLPRVWRGGRRARACPVSGYLTGRPREHTRVPRSTRRPTIAGSATEGSTLAVVPGSWKPAPARFAYRWSDCDSHGAACVPIAGATGSSRVLTAKDVGHTVRVKVTASDAAGSASASSKATAVVTGVVKPPTGGPPTVSIGAPGPPVRCTETLGPGANVSRVVTSAAAGAVICLTAGDWGDVSIVSAMSPATPVTLASAPGQTVRLAHLSIDAQVSNLTVQGFYASGFEVEAPSPGGITFQDNTVSYIPHGDAFVLDSDGHADATHPISGVTIIDNQIDHVGECLSDIYNQVHTTFSHNVCGPGLGYGDTAATDPGHYVQTGGEDDMTVTNNAFLGPADPAAARIGLHLNVFHDWGNSANLTFENNLLWHDGSIGQAMLLQTGHFDDVRIAGNLAVAADGGQAYTFWVDGTHGLQFEDNTTVDSYWGNLVTDSQTSDDYPSSTNVTYAGNITVGTVDNSDEGYGNCSSTCSVFGNVTGDSSASGQGSVKSWRARWSTIAWAPTIPYARPPAGYYRPVGLAISAGYQGLVGP